jgi:hypothetical protein
VGSGSRVDLRFTFSAGCRVTAKTYPFRIFLLFHRNRVYAFLRDLDGGRQMGRWSLRLALTRDPDGMRYARTPMFSMYSPLTIENKR